MATGFGLRLVGSMHGGRARVREYYVPSTDSTALYEGDVVEYASTGAMDGDGRVAVVTQATAGHKLLGVVVGFRPDGTRTFTQQYREASTARYVLVCDDPGAIYEVQEDAVGGSVSQQAIAESQNADIIVAAGSTVTGVSGTMLDSSTAAATSANLKIIGIRKDQTNVGAQSGGAILQVMIFEHALTAVDSDNATGTVTE